MTKEKRFCRRGGCEAS